MIDVDSESGPFQERFLRLLMERAREHIETDSDRVASLFLEEMKISGSDANPALIFEIRISL